MSSAVAQTVSRFTAEEYLEWERHQEVRHEYLAGEVFAMAGVKDAHATVAGNLFVLLRGHLRGGPCRVFMAEMKLRVERADAFFYPDLLVTCDERDRGEPADYFKSHPKVIVEVLSPSTAAYDLGAKFAHYRTLESLEEYLLIDPERLGVEAFRRGADGRWVLYPFAAGEGVEIAALGFTAPIEAFYEDVALP